MTEPEIAPLPLSEANNDENYWVVSYGMWAYKVVMDHLTHLEWLDWLKISVALFLGYVTMRSMLYLHKFIMSHCRPVMFPY